MMKKRGLILLASLFILLTAGSAACAWALDWKKLHEYADTIDAQTALAEAGKEGVSMGELYVAGLVLLNEYRQLEAQPYFERMLTVDKSSIMARWGIAECKRRNYELDDSLKILNEVIALDPSFAPAYNSKAYIQYMRTDFKDAARSAAAVINMGQDKVDLVNYVRAHSLYGGAKGMMAHYGGPLSKAVNGAAVIRHLDKARALAPGSPAVLFGYGSYYLLIPPFFGRDVDKAIDFLKQAVEADPKFPDAYVRLAQAYKLNGDIDLYRQMLDKALEIDPKNIVALDIKNGTCRFICVDITD